MSTLTTGQIAAACWLSSHAKEALLSARRLPRISQEFDRLDVVRAGRDAQAVTR